VDVDLVRPRWRYTASYRVTPRAQIGVEWNPNAGEVGFIGNYILTTESDRMPMISFGTSSDRIGTPPGPHAYYMTVAKGIPSLKMGPYFSINYSEYDRKINFPFGVNMSLTQECDLLFMNDGRKSHALLTFKQPSFNLSLIWVWFKHPGISVSFGF